MSIPESELSYGSILTLTGENAEINGKLNNKPINFTHIAIGDANDVYVQPSRTQTTLVNEITRIPVTGMEKITPSEPDGVPQLKVWAKIPDDIVDIAVREFAAVATFDGNSYLHAVGNSVRIPILSGGNNGGEVNDIFIEMTFAVTSLEPIVMIDPAIVTATRKYVGESLLAHKNEADPHGQYPLATNTQGLPYSQDRTYHPGDTCTSVVDGKVMHWEAYHDKPFSDKDPNDLNNRQTNWVDDTQPWYWSPLKKARPGTPLWPWMSMTFPEGTLNVLGNSVPVAVFWRLAEAFPEFVNGANIDFPETGGEFFRVLDQGRGIDLGRQLGTSQGFAVEEFYGAIYDSRDATVPYYDGMNATGASGSGSPKFAAGENIYTFKPTKMDGSGLIEQSEETRPRNLAFPILVEV